jgi:hypothetical protein
VITYNWPPRHGGEPLDAYGPLRDSIALTVGKRVKFTTPQGELRVGVISRQAQVTAFNGVCGLRVYLGIDLDDGRQCAAAADRLEECDETEAQIIAAQNSGAAFVEVSLW